MKQKKELPYDNSFCLAPAEGLEPPTDRLTADSSTD